MKRLVIFCTILLGSLFASAQTQQGYVKTIGRPEQPGVMLENVLVQAKGMFNATTSDDSGEFNITVPGKKDGDPIVFLRVQKKGYVLKDKDFIGQSNVCSSRVPIIIQMVDSAQLVADKKRIEDNAQRVAEENYQKKLTMLKQQCDSSIISAEQFRQDKQKLEDQYEKYLSLISDMADREAIIQDIEHAKRVAILCENLAREYNSTGERESAIQCLEKALTINKILHGEDSQETANIQQQIDELRQ